MSSRRNFLEFTTELFFYDQADDDIGAWFIGADCAGWLYARLLPVQGIRRGCDPIMEDWGWYFSVYVDEVKVSICIWCIDQNQWIVGVEAINRFFKRIPAEVIKASHDKVCDVLEQITFRDERFSGSRWHEESPL